MTINKLCMDHFRIEEEKGEGTSVVVPSSYRRRRFVHPNPPHPFLPPECNMHFCCYETTPSISPLARPQTKFGANPLSLPPKGLCTNLPLNFIQTSTLSAPSYLALVHSTYNRKRQLRSFPLVESSNCIPYSSPHTPPPSSKLQSTSSSVRASLSLSPSPI